MGTGATQIDQGAVARWAQLGYGIQRNDPRVPDDVLCIYVEVKSEPGVSTPSRYFIDFYWMQAPPPSPHVTYSCQLNQSNGVWTFVAVDQFGIPEVAVSVAGPASLTAPWIGQAANRADFNVETFNVEDRVPGSQGNPAEYFGCQVMYAGLPGLFVSAGISPANLRAQTPLYQHFFLGEEGFLIWDIRQ